MFFAVEAAHNLKVAGSNPAPATNRSETATGQMMSCGGLVVSESGRETVDAMGASVQERTESAPSTSDPGRSESTMRAQQEHNGAAFPSDLATIVAAWIRLPASLKQGIIAMVKASMQEE